MAKKKVEEMEESELLYTLLWQKHNALDMNRVLSSETLPNGMFVMKIGGKKLSETEVMNLRGEAQMISGTRLWKSMVETSKALAEESIFKSSKNIEDIHYGKAMLFCISIFENAMNQIQRPNLNQNPQEIAQKRLAKTRYQT